MDSAIELDMDCAIELDMDSADPPLQVLVQRNCLLLGSEDLTSGHQWKYVINKLASDGALKQTGTYLQSDKKDLLKLESPLVASSLKLQQDIGAELKLVRYNKC